MPENLHQHFSSLQNGGLHWKQVTGHNIVLFTDEVAKYPLRVTRHTLLSWQDEVQTLKEVKCLSKPIVCEGPVNQI